MSAKPSSTYFRLQAKKGPWKWQNQTAKGTKIMPVGMARSPYRCLHGNATHEMTLVPQTLAETFVAALVGATDGRQGSRFRPPRLQLGGTIAPECGTIAKT
jgi:hypothetical protein